MSITNEEYDNDYEVSKFMNYIKVKDSFDSCLKSITDLGYIRYRNTRYNSWIKGEYVSPVAYPSCYNDTHLRFDKDAWFSDSDTDSSEDESDEEEKEFEDERIKAVMFFRNLYKEE